MKLLLTSTLIFISLSAFCQISKSQKKKITKIIGEEYIELECEKSYSDYNCQDCQKDTSLVYVGQDDGALENEEFILFRHPIVFSTESEIYKVLRDEHVYINEYEEFENWVRDSIARHRLVVWSEDDEDAYEFGYFRLGGSNHRDQIHLKWDKKFDYDDPNLVPFFASMYLPKPERFYGKRVIDKRKLVYEYTNDYSAIKNLTSAELSKVFPLDTNWHDFNNLSAVTNRVHVIRSEYNYGKKSKFYRDEHSTLSQVWSVVHNDARLDGVRGFQAAAFCDWKSKRLQEEFDDRGLDYRVLVTLPTKKDVQNNSDKYYNYNCRPEDFTEQWRITNSEYSQFIDAVEDSILRMSIYFELQSKEDAKKYINYLDYYFSEGDLEYVELEEFDRDINWELFSLNYNTKIDLKDPEIFAIVNRFKKRNSFIYKYVEMDMYQKAIEGSFTYERENNRDGWSGSRDSIYWNMREIQENGEPKGKEYILGERNMFGEPLATRNHLNYARFMMPQSVDVMPSSGRPEENDSLINNITYEQACAFYHWKYPIHKVTADTDYTKYVFPSREEFEIVRNGGEVFKGSRTVDHATPKFRYVIHLYSKE